MMAARLHSWLHRPSWCLWCALAGILVAYHTVGEALGLPHGVEAQLESWMVTLSPSATGRVHRG